MTGDVFKKAIEKASELNPVQQDEIGSIILLELEDEARWTSAFGSNQPALEKMAEQAIKEFRAGQARPMPGDSSTEDLAS
jgi:hypothetical protein